ncbi:MAG: type II toxin-antitoxin system RelE/ParE family toxin [Chloroflexi bacterium]|nr:type II toxin-antitoxin system RelE/ParE family toxin [Chloroflexota bacterium]
MKRRVIVRPEAEDDLKEAFRWYEGKRTGLGYDFLLQVDAGINFISRNREIHPAEYQETRRHLIRRFPYKITYLIKEDEIVILAVTHGKRRPESTKRQNR